MHPGLPGLPRLHPSHQRARRWLRGLTTATTATALVLLAAPGLLADAGPAHHTATAGSTPATSSVGLELVAAKRPKRLIKRYRVRPGDTASSIAVRYHAWTDELVAMNGRTLYAGEVIRIPVVRSAQRHCTRAGHRHHRTNVASHTAPKAKHRKPTKKHSKKHTKTHTKKTVRHPHRTAHFRGWHHADASRAKVRRTIARKARRHGVDPDLALAIAWQESGWQQRRVSSAGALGAMQIMPATGRWISQVSGRRLNPRDLYHNAYTGVRLIRILRSEARPRVAIAGYYQGLAGVRRHGMYPDTKRYVANVQALKKRIDRGWSPQ